MQLLVERADQRSHQIECQSITGIAIWTEYTGATWTEVFDLKPEYGQNSAPWCYQVIAEKGSPTSRSRRLTTASIEENIDRIHHMLMEDGWLIINQIALYQSNGLS